MSLRRRAGREGRELAGAMRELARRGLVHGTVGNGSIRRDDAVWVTPTRTPYESMTARDLVPVDLETRRGSRRGPSRELPFHLAIYRARPEVRAVLHTHSPHATAWSFLDLPLPRLTEDMAYYDVGPVRTVPRAPAGSVGLARAAVAALGTSRAALLARHGVVVAAESVQEALGIAQVVEHQAQIAWLLRGDRAARYAPPPAGAAENPRRVRAVRT